MEKLGCADVLCLLGVLCLLVSSTMSSGLGSEGAIVSYDRYQNYPELFRSWAESYPGWKGKRAKVHGDEEAKRGFGSFLDDLGNKNRFGSGKFQKWNRFQKRLMRK